MTARGFAERLIDHAAAVMPEHRREWAAAMQAEFAALPAGRDRLAWAVGCVWASYCERIQPMDVFVKSLVRAAAEGVVVAAFILALLLLPPSWGGYGGLLVLVLLVFYGGMFATLSALELLIARFWKAPGKPFLKTLLRTTVLWLWPVGYEVSVFVGAWRVTLGYPHVHVDFTGYMLRILIASAGNFSFYFVAIFVPLLVCELILARFWRAKAT